MNNLSVKKFVEGMLELEKQGQYSTLVGIGPMSSNLLVATFELARDYDFPAMFIASRNQVDSDDFGSGYVNNWNQSRFKEDIQKIADQVGYDGPYYLCRDHGGPWQRDEERNAHLSESEAMELAKKSYIEDMEAGFHLLMIDPTKDPFEIGKVIPLETVLSRTVDLIEYCEKERIARNLPEIGYEVGTEETNGGLTSPEKYEEFIEKLKVELDSKNLPMPSFIVGQTGTLTRKTEQVGTYQFQNTVRLGQMAKSYGVGLKEHNADYLDDITLLEHIPAQVTALNVAPQYGTEETRAYVDLCKLEKLLFEEGVLSSTSGLYDVLLHKAILTERWRKWMVGDQVNLTVEEILSDEQLSIEILDIAGHYVFNDKEVKERIQLLYTNMNEVAIDGNRFVINRIKRPIRDYIEGLNLKGLTSKVVKVLASK